MMRKLIFLILMVVLCGFSAKAQQANVYAYGLKVVAVNVPGLTADLSYSLNTDATSGEIEILGSGGSVVGGVSLTTAQLTKGPHTVTGVPLGTGGVLDWRVKVTAAAHAAVVQFTNNSDTKNMFYAPNGLAVDNSFNSPHFGNLYVAEGLSTSNPSYFPSGRGITKDGIYIFDGKLDDLTPANDPYQGGIPWIVGTTVDYRPHSSKSPGRLATDEDGLLYIADGSTTNSGVYVMDPQFPTNTFRKIFDCASRDARGLVTSSISQDVNGPVMSLVVVGTGAGKTLYTIDREVAPMGTNASNSMLDGLVYAGNILKYNIGTSTAEWKAAPTLFWANDRIINQHNSIVSDGRGGFWVAQNRSNNDVSTLFHLTSNGVMNFEGGVDMPQILPTARGSVAVNKAGNLLAIGNGGVVRFYRITYSSSGVPTLTQETGWATTSTSNIDGIAFDVADNFYTISNSTERLKGWALPKTDNSYTTPAPASQSIQAVNIQAKNWGVPAQNTAAVAPYGPYPDVKYWVIADTSGVASNNNPLPAPTDEYPQDKTALLNWFTKESGHIEVANYDPNRTVYDDPNAKFIIKNEIDNGVVNEYRFQFWNGTDKLEVSFGQMTWNTFELLRIDAGVITQFYAQHFNTSTPTDSSVIAGYLAIPTNANAGDPSNDDIILVGSDADGAIFALKYSEWVNAETDYNNWHPLYVYIRPACPRNQYEYVTKEFLYDNQLDVVANAQHLHAANQQVIDINGGPELNADLGADADGKAIINSPKTGNTKILFEKAGLISGVDKQLYSMAPNGTTTLLPGAAALPIYFNNITEIELFFIKDADGNVLTVKNSSEFHDAGVNAEIISGLQLAWEKPYALTNDTVATQLFAIVRTGLPQYAEDTEEGRGYLGADGTYHTFIFYPVASYKWNPSTGKPTAADPVNAPLGLYYNTGIGTVAFNACQDPVNAVDAIWYVSQEQHSGLLQQKLVVADPNRLNNNGYTELPKVYVDLDKPNLSITLPCDTFIVYDKAAKKYVKLNGDFDLEPSLNELLAQWVIDEEDGKYTVTAVLGDTFPGVATPFDGKKYYILETAVEYEYNFIEIPSDPSLPYGLKTYKLTCAEQAETVIPCLDLLIQSGKYKQQTNSKPWFYKYGDTTVPTGTPNIDSTAISSHWVAKEVSNSDYYTIAGELDGSPVDAAHYFKGKTYLFNKISDKKWEAIVIDAYTNRIEISVDTLIFTCETRHVSNYQWLNGCEGQEIALVEALWQDRDIESVKESFKSATDFTIVKDTIWLSDKWTNDDAGVATTTPVYTGIKAYANYFEQYKGSDPVEFKNKLLDQVEFLNVYAVDVDTLSKANGEHLVPFYAFSVKKTDKDGKEHEYFLNVNNNTDSVYWTELSDAESYKLLDWKNNEGKYPSYKFCLPTEALERTIQEYDFYLQSMYNDKHESFLISFVGSTGELVAHEIGTLFAPTASYNPAGELYTIDYTQLDPTKVTSWIGFCSELLDNRWVNVLAVTEDFDDPDPSNPDPGNIGNTGQYYITHAEIDGGGTDFVKESGYRYPKVNYGLLTNWANAQLFTLKYVGKGNMGFTKSPIWYYEIYTDGDTSDNVIKEDSILTEAGKGGSDPFLSGFINPNFRYASFEGAKLPKADSLKYQFGFLKAEPDDPNFVNFYIVSRAEDAVGQYDPTKWHFLSDFGERLIFVDRIENATVWSLGKKAADGTFTDVKVAAKATIYGVDGAIVVKNVEGNVAIYAIDGRLVRAENVTSDATISVPAGVYVVKSGALVTKVIVK
jgi:hypothetical protein